MKVQLSPIAAILSLLSFPLLSLACDCMPPGPSALSCLSDVDVNAVFRGKVAKELAKTADDDIYYTKKFVVRVWPVFKGCSFQDSDYIIVTTMSDAALCGINLEVAGNYVFSGYNAPIDDSTLAQIDKLPWVATLNITQTVDVGSCNYHGKWDGVPEDEMRILRQNIKHCDSATDP